MPPPDGSQDPTRIFAERMAWLLGQAAEWVALGTQSEYPPHRHQAARLQSDIETTLTAWKNR